jgi:hypothetical protein
MPKPKPVGVEVGRNFFATVYTGVHAWKSSITYESQSLSLIIAIAEALFKLKDWN